ncbi:MAG: hypothetical protein PVG27_00445 [Chloroflexota bacterium]|jgi:hypothetical protein
MSASVRAIARRAMVLAAAGTLALGSLPASAAATVDELVELNLRAWNEEPELLSEVYAPEGVHTATFYDRTNEYTGPEEIDLVAGSGGIELVGPRIDIPAADGEWRWAGFASLGGGTACLFHAVDGQLLRHDCVLPEHSFDSRNPVGLADPAASAEIDTIEQRLLESWAAGTTVERLAEVYAPDAVHSARYLNRTQTHTGPEEIIRVAGHGPDRIGQRVDFEAPAGELAWASVADVAGGSVCIFRAVDGMVTRHDCVLPIPG